MGTLRNDITKALKCHDYKEGYCAGDIGSDRAKYDKLNECRRQLGISDIKNLDRWWSDQVKAQTFDFRADIKKNTILLEDELPANDNADEMLAVLYQKLLNTPNEAFGDSSGAAKQ